MAKTSRKKKVVLLVAQNKVLMDSVTGLLKGSGYKLHDICAHWQPDVHDAMTSSDTPDCALVLEYGLELSPEEGSRNRYELIKQLRENHPDLPILYYMTQEDDVFYEWAVRHVDRVIIAVGGDYDSNTVVDGLNAILEGQRDTTIPLPVEIPKRVETKRSLLDDLRAEEEKAALQKAEQSSSGTPEQMEIVEEQEPTTTPEPKRDGFILPDEAVYLHDVPSGASYNPLARDEATVASVQVRAEQAPTISFGDRIRDTVKAFMPRKGSKREMARTSTTTEEQHIAVAQDQAVDQVRQEASRVMTGELEGPIDFPERVVIGVFSLSRGAGSTRTAVELALKLMRVGRTMVIGMDGSADLYSAGLPEQVVISVPVYEEAINTLSIHISEKQYRFIILDFGLILRITNIGQPDEPLSERIHLINELRRCDRIICRSFSAPWHSQKERILSGLSLQDVIVIRDDQPELDLVQQLFPRARRRNILWN